MITTRVFWTLTDSGECSLYCTYDETSVNPPNRISSIRCNNQTDLTARVVVHDAADYSVILATHDYAPHTDTIFNTRPNQNFDFENFTVTYGFAP